MAHEVYFIFYVADQERSTAFYTEVLQRQPILDVPGITEFELMDGSILGLLRTTSASKLLGASWFEQPDDSTTPRAELYLVVDGPEAYHARALACGARELSAMAVRDWHHRAAYSLGPDGYVLAFAEKLDRAGPGGA